MLKIFLVDGNQYLRRLDSLLIKKKVVKISEPDAIQSVKDLMSTNWDDSNSDGITPTFFVSTEQSNALDYCNNNTFMLIYAPTHITVPNDLGADFSEETTDRVSLDIRTQVSRSHLRNAYNEARRIVRANINNPDANFQQLISLSFQDFSTIGFYRYVYDVRLKNWNQGD